MAPYLCTKCGHKKARVEERDGILFSYCSECGIETRMEKGVQTVQEVNKPPRRDDGPAWVRKDTEESL